jgi:TolA-binding protein
MRRAVLLTAASMLLTVCAALPAWAQMDSREGIALQNQILELRRDLQSVQAGRGSYAPPPAPRDSGRGGNDLTPQLLDRVQSMEEEVRRLRGQLDEQANAARRQNDDLSKQIADLNFRLGNGGPSSSTPAPPQRDPGPRPQPPPADAPAAPGRRPAELAMQEGNAALARRDYPAAEAAAREVLGSNRAGPRAGDAQFLLAQSLAGRRDYQAAAVAYDDAYNRSRNGSRAPDALLGLAGSLSALGERPAACATLEKLRTEFPSPRPEVRDAAATVRSRAGCR